MKLEFDKNGTAYQLISAKARDANAPLMVLIHGLGLNRHLWQWHIDAFSKYFHVLCYDLYGHGESVAPPESPNLTLLSNQLKDLIKHLGVEKAIIIGFSIGGMVARRFVMDYPEKTTAIVVMNSPHERTEEAQKIVEERAAKTYEEGAMATMDNALERWFTPIFHKNNPAIMALMRDWRKQCDADYYPHYATLLARDVLELINPQPPIGHPTFVLTCANDSGSTPEMSHAIAKEIISAQVDIVPDLRHLGLIEQPEMFTGLILAYLYKITKKTNI